MTTANAEIRELTSRDYKYGFVTDIDSDTVPPGLDEDVIRLISAKKGEPQFMLDWRLKAFRQWQRMAKGLGAKPGRGIVEMHQRGTQ